MKNRQHIGYLVLKIFSPSSLIQFIVLCFFAASYLDFKPLIAFIIFIPLLYIGVLCFKWFNTTYQVENDRIIKEYHSIFNSTSLIIKYENISTINFNASALQRLLQLGVVLITNKTAAASSHDSIDIYVSNNEYQRIKQLVDSYQGNTEDEDEDNNQTDNLYYHKYTLIDSLAYSIINGPSLILAIFIVVIVVDLVIVASPSGASPILTIITILAGTYEIINAIFSAVIKTANLEVSLLPDLRLSIRTKFLSVKQLSFRREKVKLLYETYYRLVRKYTFAVAIDQTNSNEEDNVNDPVVALLIDDKEATKIRSIFEVVNDTIYKIKPSKYVCFRLIASFLVLLITISTASYIFFEYEWVLPVSLIIIFLSGWLLIIKLLGYSKADYIRIGSKQVEISNDFFINKRYHFDYDHIEDLKIRQTLLDRILGLADLEITTFSHSLYAKTNFKAKSYNYHSLLKLTSLVLANIENDTNKSDDTESIS